MPVIVDGQVVKPEAAKPVINAPLPPMPGPAPEGKKTTSLVLFYQYVEPKWTEKEHKEALKYVIALGNRVGVFGRGRCAAEGLNCTLTGPPECIRGFCNGLREWKPALFNNTDFKITDHVDASHGFKALTIRRTDELVAYGLADERAPSLEKSQAQHVDADQYHELMKDKDAVIIDVRNAYESAIGHFQPPPGGATLIDPKMRNSHEFPKWLNAPETKKALHGKKVLMYCTGGIRCERASALMDVLTKTSEGSFETAGPPVMVRGGIERYMKTFPEGGFWKGKNYLFDRRLEQVPESKDDKALQKDVESWCAACHAPYGIYRGQFTCAGLLPPPIGKCGVPVIVCATCQKGGWLDKEALRCPLCEEGYVPPSTAPDIISLKRKFEQKVGGAAGSATDAAASAPTAGAVDSNGPRSKRAKRDAKAAAAAPSTRLFIGGLPFTTCATDVRRALSEAAAPSGGEGAPSGDYSSYASNAGPSDCVVAVRWLMDHSTKLFYGSAFVEVHSLEAAEAIVAKAAAPPPAQPPVEDDDKKKKKKSSKVGNLRRGVKPEATSATKGGIVIGGRRLRVHFSPPRDGDAPITQEEQRERPPCGAL
jgi:predicted sulfurtransferase